MRAAEASFDASYFGGAAEDYDVLRADQPSIK